MRTINHQLQTTEAQCRRKRIFTKFDVPTGRIHNRVALPNSGEGTVSMGCESDSSIFNSSSSDSLLPSALKNFDAVIGIRVVGSTDHNTCAKPSGCGSAWPPRASASGPSKVTRAPRQPDLPPGLTQTYSRTLECLCQSSTWVARSSRQTLACAHPSFSMKSAVTGILAYRAANPVGAKKSVYSSSRLLGKDCHIARASAVAATSCTRTIRAPRSTAISRKATLAKYRSSVRVIQHAGNHRLSRQPDQNRMLSTQLSQRAKSSNSDQRSCRNQIPGSRLIPIL